MIPTVSVEEQQAQGLKCLKRDCNIENESMLKCTRVECPNHYHLSCGKVGEEFIAANNNWLCSEPCRNAVLVVRLTERYEKQKTLLNKLTTELGACQEALKKSNEAETHFRNRVKELEENNVSIHELKKENAELKVKLQNISHPSNRQTDSDAEVEQLIDDESDEELRKSLHAVMKDKSYAAFYAPSSSPLRKDNRRAPSTSKTAINLMSETEKLTHFQRLHVQRLEVPKLMKYSGDPAEWLSFQSSFERLREKGEYDNETMIEKLRESLNGDAEKYVKQRLNQPFAQADNIMDVLKKKFFQPKEAVARALKTLEDWKTIPDKCKAELESFLFEMDNYIYLCKTLKFSPELEVAINSRITNKLPYDIEVKWQQRVSQQKIKGNVLEMSEFLWEIVPNLPSRETTTRHEDQSKRFESKKYSVHLASDESSGKKWKRGDKIPCWHCGKDEMHVLYRCPKFREMSYDERVQFLSRNKICTRCIASNQHAAINCPREGKIPNCNRRNCKDPTKHCSLMHPSGGRQEGRPGSSAAINHVGGIAKTMFKVLPIYVFNSRGEKIVTTALIDGGAGASLINKAFFNKLGIDGTPYRLELTWMQEGASHSDSLAIMHDLQIAPIHNPSRIFTLTKVSAIEGLTLPEQEQCARLLKSEFPYLRDAKIPSYEKQRPQILIGLPHQRFTLELDTIWDPKLESAPIAQRTPLGWTVSGSKWSNRSILHVCSDPTEECSHEAEEIKGNDSLTELHETIKHFHSFDIMGVANPSRQHVCKDDATALRIQRLTMRQVENRYEIGLYWRSDDCKLPDNYTTALNRLKNTETRLRKLKMVQWANEHHQLLEKLGFVRVATNADLNPAKPHERVNYVIGFVTFNQNKQPPKPRWVVDTASKHNGVSLNSQLLKGPDNLVPLTQALFHFRERAIATVGDVTKMYHQILIKKEDQQAQRFLWRDCDSSREPTIFIFQSMLFGPTCSPSQANSVRIDVAKKSKQKFPNGSRVALSSMYMDDEFNSEDTVEMAAKTANETIEMFKTISWDSVGFKSNSEEVLKLLPPANIDNELMVELGSDDEILSRKVLGLSWNPKTDVFIFRVAKNVDMISLTLHDDYHPTKLEVLSFIMRIFDCLGIISHFVIRGKMILQSIWRCGIGWKEKIPKDIFDAWRLWIAKFEEIERLEIPRHYGYDSRFARNTTLHVFVDASLEAYAAVAFIRFQIDGRNCVAQVMSKCRVAPVKYASVPKLELMAALIGARLANTIKQQHTRIEFESTTFWSDSITVLRWLYAPNLRLQQFVAPRVSEIQESTNVNDWRYVPTAENVADDGTKWNDIDFSSSAQRWLKGPKFLYEEEAEWPAKFPANVNLEEHRILIASLRQDEEKESKGFYYAGIFKSVSSKIRASWESYRMVIAWVNRFKNNLLVKIRSKGQNDSSAQTSRDPVISPEELRAAEHLIFKRIQKEIFEDEWISLSKGRKLKVSSKLYELNAYVDKNGLLRAKTRMSMEETIPEDMRCPPILPNKHESVHAFVKFLHEKNLHIGVEGTAAEARSQTWIIHVRRAVQRVRSQCLYCIDQKARQQIPPTAPLPSFRLTPTTNAFEHCGVDCCGPFTIYSGRSRHKRDVWVVVFTCMVTRAIFLRKLDSMSADEMLLAIQDVWTRRGPIRHMYSDNGRNFIGSARIIKTNHLQLLAKEKRLTWHFNPALTPQWGGAWERLIRDIKRAMKAEMNGKVLVEKVFECMLLQIEDIMNSRPLTHLPVSPDDLAPLTPNFLVKQHPGYSFVQGDAKVDDDEARLYAKRARKLSASLTTRWIKEYLSTISGPKRKGPERDGLKLDDYVIYMDPQLKPSEWRRGIVVNTYTGRDGIARVADVKLKDNSILTKRSVHRLAKLRIDENFFRDDTILLNSVVNTSLDEKGKAKFLSPETTSTFLVRHKYRKIVEFFNKIASKMQLDTIATIRLWNELGQMEFHRKQSIRDGEIGEAHSVSEILSREPHADRENNKTIKINRVPVDSNFMELILCLTKLNWSATRIIVDSIRQEAGCFAFVTLETREMCEEAISKGVLEIQGRQCKVTKPKEGNNILEKSSFEYGFINWHKGRLTNCAVILARQINGADQQHSFPRFSGQQLDDYASYIREIDNCFAFLATAEARERAKKEKEENETAKPKLASIIVRAPAPGKDREVKFGRRN